MLATTPTINHSKTFTYSHMGEDISATEAIRCQEELTKLIQNVEKSREVDSPLFQHIQSVQPYILPEEEYFQLIKYYSQNQPKYIHYHTKQSITQYRTTKFRYTKNKKKLYALYKQGYADGMKSINRLKAYLEK